MKNYPAVFVNHGAGPMPLLGRQPAIVEHLRDVRKNHLPAELPDAIVMISGHWEGNPIKISSAKNPPMYYDYSGFPPEAYAFQYPAPGSPELAHQIQKLLTTKHMDSVLDGKRGFDHGAFVALMEMFPEATIPVVMVSMHSSLSVKDNVALGEALAPLRQQNILILGSGSTFHNMAAGFHPSTKYFQAGMQFNEWLKRAVVDEPKNNRGSALDNLKEWTQAPSARICHPRADHFIPLIVVAAAAASSSSSSGGEMIYDYGGGQDLGGGFMDLAVSSYKFN